MARRRRARALVAGWAAFVVALAGLALECRRAPSSTSARASADDRSAARAFPVGESATRAPQDAPARAARRVDWSGNACVLSGMVYGSDGKPAPHVPVTVDALAPAGGDGDRDDEISGTSDGNGAFSIDVPPGDYALTAVTDEQISDVVQPLALGPGERLDGLELYLGAGAPLTGRVLLDPELDSEIADVALCVLLHEHDEACFADGTVERDGRFTITGLPVRPLWLRARGSDAETTLAVTPPARDLTLRLAPQPTVSGIVYADGAPVESGEVMVNDATGHLLHDLTTDEEGRFSVRTGEKGALQVWARSDGRGVSSVLQVAADRAGGLILTLHASASIAGRVVSRGNGAPLPGGLVELSTTLGQPLQLARVDENGAYRFTDVAPGRTRVTLRSRGEVAGLPTVEVDAPTSGEARAPDLAIDRPRTLRGRVVDRAGQPVPRAEVDLIDSDGNMMLATGGEADARGNFTLVTKLVGPIAVRAWATGQVGERRQVGESLGLDDEWVELTVTDECAVSGVVRGDGGLPRAGARITCGGVTRASTGAGRFDLNCACDTGALTVDDGHGARQVPVHLGADGSIYVEVRL